MPFYDRQGIEIGVLEWARKYDDAAYCEVNTTDLFAPDGNYRVSTIWRGNTHDFGPRLIFETVVFRIDGDPRPTVEAVAGYNTEDEAQDGHERLVAATQAKHPDAYRVVPSWKPQQRL